MSLLGHHVTYKVLDAHRATTVKGEAVLAGSVHHPEMDEFAGVVTRSHEDGSHDLMLFVPNKPADRHIHNATEGLGPHQFKIVGKDYPEEAEKTGC